MEVDLSVRCALDAKPRPLPPMKMIEPPQRSVDAEWGPLVGVKLQSPQKALDDEFGLPAGVEKFLPPQGAQKVYLGP